MTATPTQNAITKDAIKQNLASHKNINLIVITDMVSNDAQLQKALIKTSDIINSLL